MEWRAVNAHVEAQNGGVEGLLTSVRKFASMWWGTVMRISHPAPFPVNGLYSIVDKRAAC